MAHVSADATPVPPPIELVCLHALAGDTPSLCAAACVSRDWHAAVTGTASAWRALALGETARGALTDARLLALVARACGNLESVDLRGACHLTDAGLLAALAPQAKLSRVLLAGCEAQTAGGVLAALGGKRSLVMLSVNSLQADDAQRAAQQLARIQALVPDAQTLDVSGVCTLLKPSGEECARLRGAPGERFARTHAHIDLCRLEAQGTRACDACGVLGACALCAADFKECVFCRLAMCKRCADRGSGGAGMSECAHCHVVQCSGNLDGSDDVSCKACAKEYCAACSALHGAAAVVIECARCNAWLCAKPCAQDAGMLSVRVGCPCPHDSEADEQMMLCAGCSADVEDALAGELGALHV
jgi:hypothetical protein